MYALKLTEGKRKDKCIFKNSAKNNTAMHEKERNAIYNDKDKNEITGNWTQLFIFQARKILESVFILSSWKIAFHFFVEFSKFWMENKGEYKLEVEKFIRDMNEKIFFWSYMEKFHGFPV